MKETSQLEQYRFPKATRSRASHSSCEPEGAAENSRAVPWGPYQAAGGTGTFTHAFLPSPGVGVEEGYLKNSIYVENAYAFLGRLPGCQPPTPTPTLQKDTGPQSIWGGVGAGLRTARLGCSALPCPARLPAHCEGTLELPGQAAGAHRGAGCGGPFLWVPRPCLFALLSPGGRARTGMRMHMSPARCGKACRAFLGMDP
ncbi:uncharacterized protein LOC102745491 [Leptonychotes weddellii]|uniref:Uncharacterized protein LOC102745491 n=1 Tax=Leptonychotes weddellii TaxID=9713 RepID=A0A7F8RQK5_LEPWE|nr:uncharacterized protein LOC102745491 [Leptonychotes weddellii]